MGPTRKRTESREPGSEGEDKPPHVLPKDLYNTYALKRALDDAVAEALPTLGHPIDHRLDDTRLAIGGAAVTVGAVAQLWPGDRIRNRVLLTVCVGLYAVLYLALALWGWLVDGEVVVRTRGGGGRVALAVSTTLPKHSDSYTIKVAPRGAGRVDPPAAGAEGGGDVTGGARARARPDAAGPRRAAQAEGAPEAAVTKPPLSRSLSNAQQHHQPKSEDVAVGSPHPSPPAPQGISPGHTSVPSLVVAAIPVASATVPVRQLVHADGHVSREALETELAALLGRARWSARVAVADGGKLE